MKEVVKGRVPDTMDTLVQQTESPFTAEVLHFPLPAKFRMPQVEAFDGVKDPVDHLNTYKNQMELHGYQDSVWCRAFSITLKGPALAWFNRLPLSSISSFRELSIAFVQKAKLSSADDQAGLTGKHEVLSPKIQCRVSKSRYTRREICDHVIHHRLGCSIERLDVFHVQKSPSKHG